MAIKKLLLPPGAKMPNSALRVMLYESAVPGGATALHRTFKDHGWGGSWTNGIYPYDHFHTNVHEVLGVAAGWVEVQLGGDEGETVRLNAGDVVVLPAGTGHRRISASKDYSIVGAYPNGQHTPDLHRDRADCLDCDARLKAVPLPDSDPVLGAAGPLPAAWR